MCQQGHLPVRVPQPVRIGAFNGDPHPGTTCSTTTAGHVPRLGLVKHFSPAEMSTFGRWSRRRPWITTTRSSGRSSRYRHVEPGARIDRSGRRYFSHFYDTVRTNAVMTGPVRTRTDRPPHVRSNSPISQSTTVPRAFVFVRDQPRALRAARRTRRQRQLSTHRCQLSAIRRRGRVHRLRTRRPPRSPPTPEPTRASSSVGGRGGVMGSSIR